MRLLGYFHPRLPIYLVYMLQQVEYEPGKFASWIGRLPDIKRIMYRQSLVATPKAKLLAASAYFIWGLAILCAFLFLEGPLILAGLLISPAIVVIWLLLVTSFARVFVEGPRRKVILSEAEEIFAKHTGQKIAVLGSYGKTTTKELLTTVLSQHKNVAATPLNRNVPISHARWAKKLKGDEEILIIEYGEGAPGDIAKLAELTHPDLAIITGVAPVHLDKYKNMERLKNDLLSIKKYVNSDTVYNLAQQMRGVEINLEKLDVGGMSFAAKLQGETLTGLKTRLVGEHLLPTLAVCILLAKRFGLSDNQIKEGISQTKPFEHRLHPYRLHDAWIIDDTYNGNLEGVRAGLKLLRQLKAKRKLYVTPGLVDQGDESERVHSEIGRLIAESNPDKVVLMKNSVIDYIKNGLTEGGYKGSLEVENDPLLFYQNLEHKVASGDLVLLQNDWPDSYQ